MPFPTPLFRKFICLAIALAGVTTPVLSTPSVGPWVPLLKGVDYSVSTNLSRSDGFLNRQVVHALRVDLKDPDIRLLTSPQMVDYAPNVREIEGLTVSSFLKRHRLQAAINANFFHPNDYYLPAGTPMDIYGLAISQGVVVSEQNGRSFSSAIVFDANNQASFLPTNWPAISNADIYTAVSGDAALVVDGKNVVPRNNVRDAAPRTVFGLTQDRQYLLILAIDGRQPGYSDGANDYESAEWLLLLGATDGINLDGGGSTTLVVEGSTGAPVRLNRSSAVADSGKERTVGSHFGLYAKPLPGFINEVVVVPDDTTAQITWTTRAPATAEVQYGLTTDLGLSAGEPSVQQTQHRVQLTGLAPATGYYFRVVSAAGTDLHVSSNFFFVTTNYVTTNQLFDLTQTWKYSTAPRNNLEWTQLVEDETPWSEPGPGLLWVDVRATGPNPSVEPKNTEMPGDANNNGYPYVTYYFRTHFELTNLVPHSSLWFSGYVDDGAIFYLNGAEIYRLRMPEPADAQTLASEYPCGGDATCLDEFAIPVEAIPQLTQGDNVLAVEVHNYNLRSADITFGLSLSRVEPITRVPKLDIQFTAGRVILTWEGTAFLLQSALSPTGPWTDVGAAKASPFSVEPQLPNTYYRLKK